MAYELEETDSLGKTLTLQIPKSDIDRLVNGKLRKLQKTVKIHGFRKGKVPMSVMKQRYSGGAYQEAIEELLEKETATALQHYDRVVFLGRHNVQPKEDGGLESKIYVEFAPTIDPVGYLGLEISAPSAEPTDDDIFNQMQMLQRQFAVLEPIEDRDTVEVGDVVVIDFTPVSKTVDSLEDSQITGREVTVAIEEDEEKRIPLANALVGCSKNDPITLVMKLEDMGFKGYGPDESCTLDVRIHSINKQILPKLNDELALESGIRDTYEELEEFVGEQIKKAKEERRRSILHDAVGKELLKIFTFELPPRFVENEIDGRIRQQLSQMGYPDAMNPQLDLSKLLPDLAQVRESMRPTIEDSVRLTFIANEVFDAEKLTITDQDLNDYAVSRAQASGIPPQQFLEYLSKNEAQLRGLTGTLRIEKALDFLTENAEITEISEEEFEKRMKEEMAKVEAAQNHDHDHDHAAHDHATHDHDHDEEE